MRKKIAAALFCILVMTGCTSKPEKIEETTTTPRIVNIINFIRQTEPRRSENSGAGGESREIVDEELYQTVVEQVKLLKKHNLPGTFLLQYDALINPKYQQLLQKEKNCEIGAWWEITQPHVEAAGMKWRGRFPWDWHANVGFATGYTPEERERLVDVYMEKFKSIFGKYPASVGSWFIDAHTLGYLYEKYNITASCNCRDQIGTDGYTLWGGYWNQGYYPSKINAYMPAQTEEGQIPVPIFRMLGSDPIYQYGGGGIITLEPVYTGVEGGGAVKPWVDWFLASIVEEPCVYYNYVQVGQENSFTWPAMQKGLELQIPIVDSLRKAGKVRVETLEASGRWFKSKFRMTPSTAVTSKPDYRKKGDRGVWYNSRFYRANLLWEGSHFRFRDIHIFDERVESSYYRTPGTSTECIYLTLPIVDGAYWGSWDVPAGLRLVDEAGQQFEVSAPIIEDASDRALRVTFKIASGEEFKILLDEKNFTITSTKAEGWSLDLFVKPDANLPFKSYGERLLMASFLDTDYGIRCVKGTLEKKENNTFRIKPKNGKIVVNCADREYNPAI